MAKQITLIRSQGSTMGYELPFTKDGIAIDITTFKIYFTLKNKKEDDDDVAKVNKTITIHTDPAAGVALIEFLASDTSDLLGNYYFSIEYKDTSELYGQDVLFQGRITITKNTRGTRD